MLISALFRGYFYPYKNIGSSTLSEEQALCQEVTRVENSVYIISVSERLYILVPMHNTLPNNYTCLVLFITLYF